MAEHHYDVVVIGAGPSGEGAAMNAAKHNRRVAIIEDKPTVGGNCTHWGTIPSKALTLVNRSGSLFRGYCRTPRR